MKRASTESLIFEEWTSPWGVLKIGVYDDQLCMCDWQYRKMRGQIDFRISQALNTTMQLGKHPLIDQCKEQLLAYEKGHLTSFDIPLLFAGTDFQKRVWKELLNIPYGTTTTYMALSQKLENTLAIRAVAAANGANAISIIVPCHRVIGSDGELTGYAGGLTAKKKLLSLEGAPVTKQQSLF